MNSLLIYLYSSSVISSLIIGALIRLPLKPDMDSFEGNVLFPNIFVALGLTAITNFLFNINMDIISYLIAGIVIGIISALFSKYANRIFPGVDYATH
ncbi:energy-converting NiFe hydrogenase A subunit EhaA [Methanothermococcus okinawensis]|uniref:Probable [NiFe]-hydrogenase-type-3 Eha complex membrane subunit A n=1 Tax=Methanothermococcus okinawensis (strain DSM 14208 / JCM 11175 / IH1) TaxID=647113 RepID=F8ANF7_METOI|nr:energy-converting NiFe hydrogenase A subunit EhaA [Methanothermococcus okinawensis]AEH07011.1 hypothetical protein Metok_1041 [Methanothermococcus okinawensis IH1]